MQIQNSDPSHWPVVIFTSLLPALVVFSLFIFSARHFHRGRLNFLFSYFLLLTTGWIASEGAVRISGTMEAARDWQRISEIFVIVMLAVGVLFVVQFGNWNARHKGYVLASLVFAPMIAFFVLLEKKVIDNKLEPSDTWGWLSAPVLSPATVVLMTWIAGCACAMLWIVWRLYFRRLDINEKKQALLLACGLTIPAVLGIAVEIIVPMFSTKASVPIAAPGMTIFACCAFIAVERYYFLDYSPKHHWQQIMECLNDGILIVDTNERIMYVNSAFCRLSGFSYNELIGCTVSEKLMDDEGRMHLLTVMEQRKRKEGGRYEIGIVTKEGKKVWVLINGIPYVTRSGKVIGSIGVQTDISAIKEKERQLLQSERKLKEAQAVARVGSWELDLQTGVSVWSEEACRIYGVDPAERFSMSYERWLSYVHPHDRERTLKSTEAARAAGADADLYYRIVASDGSIKHVHAITKTGYGIDGSASSLFGICHDMTQIRNMESALAASEALTRTFLTESPMCIYFFDPDSGVIKYANPAFHAFTGFAAGDVILETALRGDASQETPAAEAARTGITVSRETVWRTRTGQLRNVFVNAVQREVNGKRVVYVTAQDITDRVKAEKSLMAVNDELETFVYKASHDLRGPLASILGLVNVSKLEPLEKTAAYISMIEKASLKLDETLLQLTKAMKLKSTGNFTDEVEFSSLLSEVLARFEYYDGYSDMRFDVHIHTAEPFYTNRTVMETALQNLVENAIKYRRKQEGRCFLKIEVLDDGKFAKLIFEDNGIGIEDGLQDNVFDMYFRGTELSQGSGLGLYLVKKGIDLLQGDISLRSVPGRGTVITLLVPKREQPSRNAHRNQLKGPNSMHAAFAGSPAA